MLIPDEQDRALSLLQPWATLVVLGIKTVETRSWRTAYRGPLLIHASNSRAGRELATFPQITKHIPAFSSLPFGAVIGRVLLEDIVPYDPVSNDLADVDDTLELGAFGEKLHGRWAFLLKEAVAFDLPIPAPGRQGIFRL